MLLWFIPFSIIHDSQPTFQFGYGGSADFRGRDNTYFNIFSANGISLNMKTTDYETLLPRPTLLKSSFFTEAHISMYTKNTKKKVLVSMFSKNKGYKTIINDVETEKFDVWKDTQEDSVRILSKESTNLVRANGWEMNITRVPIDYLVTDVINADKKWRYNIRISPLTEEKHLKMYGKPNMESVHGLLGHSLDYNMLSYNGEKTNYDKVYVDQKEQASGSIEGIWKDYIMSEPFETDFKFSRYNTIGKHVKCIDKMNVSSSVLLAGQIPLAIINDDLGKKDFKRKVQ